MTFPQQLGCDQVQALRTRYEIGAPVFKEISDGYYAVQRADTAALDFIRISHPKGQFKVQTIHGDNLMIAIWDKYTNRFGKSFTWFNQPRIVDLLTEILVDRTRASILFAQHKGRCCRCGTGLTDERSRYFGIGPECEKFRPDVIEMVTLEKGFYEFRQTEGVDFGV